MSGKSKAERVLEANRITLRKIIEEMREEHDTYRSKAEFFFSLAKGEDEFWEEGMTYDWVADILYRYIRALQELLNEMWIDEHDNKKEG